ncbi:hypothetical protein DIS11_04200 [Leuconostoc citreum]|nr:hypothetical protein CMW49_04205 [Leuconostoc citreum]TPF03052.1 hypothetical protein DIS11_04200 [Leuconostoc citreum]
MEKLKSFIFELDDETEPDELDALDELIDFEYFDDELEAFSLLIEDELCVFKFSELDLSGLGDSAPTIRKEAMLTNSKHHVCLVVLPITFLSFLLAMKNQINVTKNTSTNSDTI